MKKASLYFLCLILIIAVAVSCGGGGGGGGGGAIALNHGLHNGGDAGGWGNGNHTGNGFGGNGGIGSGDDGEIVITGSTPLNVTKYVYNGTEYSDVTALTTALRASGELPDSFNIDFYVDSETTPRTARVTANGQANNGNDIFIEHQYKAVFPASDGSGGIEEVLFYKRDGIKLPGDPAGTVENGFTFETNWNIDGSHYPCGSTIGVATSGDVDFSTATQEIASYGFKEDNGDYILGFRSSPAPTGDIAIHTNKVIKQVDLTSGSSMNLDFTGVTFKNNVIDSSSFTGTRSNLAGITLPSGLTAIGDYTFLTGYSNLETVVIPGSVTSIGDLAFKSCSALENITILGSGLQTIGDSAFYSCSSLQAFEMPNSVTTLGENAFYGCSDLATLTLSNHLTEIPNNAFYGCSNLDSTLDIPASVTAIGNSAFQDCSSIDALTLHTGLTAIGDNAFQGCSDLDAVSIPNGVTTIGTAAFLLCSDLAQISIPPSVNSIGNSAFNSVKTDCVLTINNNGTPITLGGPLALPNSNFSVSLTGSSIPMQAGGTASIFDSNTNLTEVTLADSVSAIPANAFNGCSDLAEITISSNIDSIGAGAFNGIASGITITFESNQNISPCNLPTTPFNVVLLSGVPTNNAESIFESVQSLQSVVFKGGQLAVNMAFSGCDNLTTVTFNSYPSAIAINIFPDDVHGIIFDPYPNIMDNVANVSRLLTPGRDFSSSGHPLTVTFKNNSTTTMTIQSGAFDFTGAENITYNFEAAPDHNMVYKDVDCFKTGATAHYNGTTYHWNATSKSWQP